MGALGRRAAEQGVPIGRAIDLYLSATWRLWRRLPVVSSAVDPEAVRLAGEAMLRVVNDTIAALVDGYLAARRQIVRREEAMRRELIDWFTLHAAVLGARLLGWPRRQLTTSG